MNNIFLYQNDKFKRFLQKTLQGPGYEENSCQVSAAGKISNC